MKGMKEEVMKEEVARLQIAAEAWSPERVIEWAFETFAETGFQRMGGFGERGK